jgi:hypothetical protein
VKGTDTLFAAALLTLVACGSARPSPVSFHFGEAGAVDLPAGPYRVTWAGDCSPLFLEVAPDNGADTEAPSPGPRGSLDVQWPGGRGYVNSGWPCDYVVTVSPAG